MFDLPKLGARLIKAVASKTSGRGPRFNRNGQPSASVSEHKSAAKEKRERKRLKRKRDAQLVLQRRQERE